MPYFIQYQLNMKDQVSFVLLAMLVTIGIFLIPAKLVSDKINKGPTYALGLFIASLAVMTGFFFPHAATPLIYVVAIVAGIGFSAQWVFPWSMLPDVIEYDEKMTGERREGIYYGLWAFLTKFTGALGVAVSGWALRLLWICAERGADGACLVWHPVILCHRAGGCPPDQPAIPDLVSDHPQETCRAGQGTWPDRKARNQLSSGGQREDRHHRFGYGRPDRWSLPGQGRACRHRV